MTALAVILFFAYLVGLFWINGWESVKLIPEDDSTSSLLQMVSSYNFNGTWESLHGDFNKSIRKINNNKGKAAMKLFYFRPRRSLYSESKEKPSGIYRIFLTLMDGEYNTNNFNFKINFEDNDIEGNSIKLTKDLTKFGEDYKQIGKINRMQF